MKRAFTTTIRPGLAGLAMVLPMTVAGAADNLAPNAARCQAGYELIGSLCMHPVSGDVILTLVQNEGGGQAKAAAPQGANPWYVVTEITGLIDAEAYARAVSAAEPSATESSGGKFFVRTSKPVMLDGENAPTRVIIIRFGSEAQARAWKDQPSIRALHAVRVKATKSRSYLVEGLPN